jgi:hypothetical protein
MIRKRLMAAVRRQDWMAVTVELLTVVFGLFLGLQLNAWKEDRDAHGREQAALERLQQESETIVAYFREFVAEFDEITTREEDAIAALSAGDKAKFGPGELADRLAPLGFYPGIAPPRAVYDELNASGLMNDIASVAVRTAVADYYAQLVYIQSQLDYFRLGAATRDAAADPGWTTRFDTKAKGPDRFVDTVDFEAVAGNRDRMTTLINDFRNQLKFQYYRRQATTKAEAMCKALADALGKTCAAASGP